MKNIAVISSSVRTGRLSHRVALFICDYVRRKYECNVTLLDLKEYGFPLFDERLSFMTDPPAGAEDFAEKIIRADGVIVVSPVYNASFPAALKNVIDLLYDDWVRKPVLVVSVTYGKTPGIATVQHLQTLFLKLQARVAGPIYTVLEAGKDFSETGEPLDVATAEKYAKAPIKEFLWLVEKSS